MSIEVERMMQGFTNRVTSYGAQMRLAGEMTAAMKELRWQIRQENALLELKSRRQQSKQLGQLQYATSQLDLAVKSGADIPAVRSAAGILHRMSAGGSIDRAGLQSALSLLRNALANDDARSKGSNVGGSYFGGRLLPYSHKAIL